ncbi:MAG: fumarylacetoacetate hydrolase family protein [Alphaproteobacteria bacterium]|nr:fumarylacetoacetate hydrolase family protein [Alphaproteobacteria bacterium]
MKLASFKVGGLSTWGLIERDQAIDVGTTLRERFGDLKRFLEGGDLALLDKASAASRRYDLGDIVWLPVIPNPDKIICIGLNYEMHREETGRAEVGYPTVFTRFSNTQTGHLTAIERPAVSLELDFEGELAIVIGKSGRHIKRERAFDHVAGYACYNEASVRDFQRHTHQFAPGKNFPRTGAFGPWLVTADEVTDVTKLRLQTRLNGEVVQDAFIEQMIFDIPAQIEYCSSFTELVVGDVIVTGTPGGVGSRRTPPLWMKPGDVVEVEIDQVGLLRNPIAQESST